MERLIVCGGGHVGTEVGLLGVRINFDVIVIDDREEFTDPARVPGATMVCASFEKALEDLGSRDSDYYAIMTRGHAFDEECLEQILRGKYAYVGMMGSDRKVATIRKHLLEKGFSAEQLDGVKAPIGLPIGGDTPAEIAVSIAAQLVEERCLRHEGGEQSLPAPPDEEGVLCRIIEADGSTPRGVGAWMLVAPDGTIKGTVGGGKLEAEVIEEALQLWKSTANSVRKKYILDNTAEEDLGMICGGDAVLELVRWPNSKACPGKELCDKNECPFAE